MSASPGRCSSVSSSSLLECKTETHLVLQAFLQRTLSTPLKERPGRVGGTYRDFTKHRSEPLPKPEDGLDPKVDNATPGEEKKSGFKDLMTQLPLHNLSLFTSKDSKGSLDSRTKHLKGQLEDEVTSPSSTSEDDDSDRKQQRKLSRKKVRKRIAKFFRLKPALEKEEHRPGPQRPRSLLVNQGVECSTNIGSPTHSPDLYRDVAEKLDKLAKRSTSIKRRPPVQPPPVVCEKEEVVRQLVQVLSVEGDSINTKIQSNPFLRSSLSRLSYASFARLLNTFSSGQIYEAPALPAPASPTLQRLAITMEVSRRIVTATGTRRMQSYAECYMESFAPWVNSNGGWEKLKDLEEFD